MPVRRLLRNLLRDDEPFEPGSVEVGGRPLPVVFRRNARARRLIVRMAAKGDGVIVTVPVRTSRVKALAFVTESHEWIATRLARRPARIGFLQGARIPLRGVMHEVRPGSSRRGTVMVDSENVVLAVSGDPAHLQRRLRDWLIAQARHDLSEASRRYAEAIGVKLRRISVRDQSSRWGSCSSSGSLSYSWRLILAPSFVLDYVAAHEVAHLVHMNHGTKFWRLVFQHCQDARKARDWLKQHGAELHRYG